MLLLLEGVGPGGAPRALSVPHHPPQSPRSPAGEKFFNQSPQPQATPAPILSRAPPVSPGIGAVRNTHEVACLTHLFLSEGPGLGLHYDPPGQKQGFLQRKPRREPIWCPECCA